MLAHLGWLMAQVATLLALMVIPTQRVAWLGVAVAVALAMLFANGLRFAPREAVQGYYAPYTPHCTSGPLPVCVHPAYAALLPDTEAVLQPMLTPLVGVAGGSVRATQ